MTEKEYILVSDFRTISMVRSAISEVVPANNPHVPEEEWRAVALMLGRWEKAISKAIKVR